MKYQQNIIEFYKEKQQKSAHLLQRPLFNRRNRKLNFPHFRERYSVNLNSYVINEDHLRTSINGKIHFSVKKSFSPVSVENLRSPLSKQLLLKAPFNS